MHRLPPYSQCFFDGCQGEEQCVTERVGGVLWGRMGGQDRLMPVSTGMTGLVGDIT